MSERLAEAEGLGRAFGSGDGVVLALTDAAFEVHPGDRIALTGPSGSGKSTLLHLVAGIDEPTSGSIRWPGIGPRDMLRPGPVALAFQGPSLLPPLDVLENVGLPLLLSGASESEARERAREMLDRFALADVTTRLPEELSGGQQQRAGLARALAGRPRLLLADEPTGQQDREGGVRVIDAVLACLSQTPGAALLVATHDARVADRLGRVWTLERGRLVTDGARR